MNVVFFKECWMSKGKNRKKIYDEEKRRILF